MIKFCTKLGLFKVNFCSELGLFLGKICLKLGLFYIVFIINNLSHAIRQKIVGTL